MQQHAFGRRVPKEWDHVTKHPFSLTVPQTFTIERKLSLPYWHWSHDQGTEGACVGFGTSMMMSIINKHRYDCNWLWNEAKAVDEWPDTNPGDDQGTSVKAACDILRVKGHVRKGKKVANLNDGISENSWATTVDDLRGCILKALPVSIGINWYSNFDTPTIKGKEMWIGEGNLGSIRGGHCLCLYGASDKRQAFILKNSWGKSYPLVWIPYITMQRLLTEEGEATMVTDRI